MNSLSLLILKSHISPTLFFSTLACVEIGSTIMHRRFQPGRQDLTIHKDHQLSLPLLNEESGKGTAAGGTPAMRYPRRTRRRRAGLRNYISSLCSSMEREDWILLAISFLSFLFIGALVLFFFVFGSSRHGGRHQSLHFNNRHSSFGKDDDEDLKPLPFNPLYKVPESMSTVGDRSNAYVTLRKEMDQLLPDDPSRSLQRVKELTRHDLGTVLMAAHHSDQVNTYNIYDCPQEPPAGYPYSWKLSEILASWPAENVQPPPQIHQGLCVFDYQKDYEKAMAYQDAELPFVVINDPAVLKTAERWNAPGYMERLLGDVPHRCEYSENNHFMYFTPGGTGKHRNQKVPEGWTEPTKLMRLTYREWLKHANVSEAFLGPDQPHWYFRLIGCGLMGNEGTCDKGSSEYLYDELPFFQPKKSLYVKKPEYQQGVHCRFGMERVIAENHFDGSRNSITVLGGSRRYILSHPSQCQNLALFPKEHPSARHSAIDWTNPDYEEYPEFKEAAGNEVVLQPGQVLYLPTYWFHYIVSLELNFQCNTRSGTSSHYAKAIEECGFPTGQITG